MRWIYRFLFIGMLIVLISFFPRTQKASLDIEGHRGCRGLMPENTIPAMLKAVDLGVTTLEMDASFTADKKIILSHEPFFNHEISTKPDGTTFTGKEERSYNIYKMTYEEVKKWDVGLKVNPRFPGQIKMKVSKPLLTDMIDAVEQKISNENRTPVYYNIETKCMPGTDNIYHPGPQEFVDRLMEVIKKKKLEDRVIIQSFDFRTLKLVHEKYPGIRTAALVEGFDMRPVEVQLKSLGFDPDIYSPDYTLVTKELIDFCHKRNINVIPWTIDSPVIAKNLVILGIDGIITDFPDKINGDLFKNSDQ